MGTFATIRMPLDLTRRSGADIIARMVVETFAGTRNVELDAAAGAVTFEMHFPGNLSALVRQLHGKLIPTG
ncbi:MAG: hypothetical protein M3N13_08865, partial [Candidatus Eremiobacteraeota bacterium]|nr:hypothetical protein [Candidatus Eremiobacteraeota bacterium]